MLTDRSMYSRKIIIYGVNGDIPEKTRTTVPSPEGRGFESIAVVLQMSRGINALAVLTLLLCLILFDLPNLLFSEYEYSNGLQKSIVRSSFSGPHTHESSLFPSASQLD